MAEYTITIQVPDGAAPAAGRVATSQRLGPSLSLFQKAKGGGDSGDKGGGDSGDKGGGDSGDKGGGDSGDKGGGDSGDKGGGGGGSNAPVIIGPIVINR